MKILKKFFDSCFYFLLAGLYLNNLNITGDRLDERLMSTLVDKYWELINPSEFYSLKTTDLDFSLFSLAAIEENSVEKVSPFFCNSLITEIDITMRFLSCLQQSDPSGDINNLSNFQTSINKSSINGNFFFVFAKGRKNTSKIRIYYNHCSCKKSSELENPDQYQSFYFTKDKVEATKIEDLQAAFGNDLIRLVPEKILVVFIEEISCVFSEWISHATVLVISREVDSFRAFYCDSNGHDMPPVLRTFLKETFTEMINKNYINKYYLDYSNKRQQLNDQCVIFATINSDLISNKINEGASFEEIKRALNYQPSINYLKKTAWKLSNDFSRGLCYNSIKKIKILIDLIEKLIQKSHSVLLSDQELVENIKENAEELQCLIIILERIFKVKGDFVSESNKKFFSEEVLNFEKTLTETPFFLKKAFYKYYESLINSFEQKERKTNCVECKKIIRNKKNICLKKRDFDWYDLSHFTQMIENSVGYHNVRKLDVEEETENSISNCPLCQKKI